MPKQTAEPSSEIVLSKPPLSEAWLDIRWRLQETPPGLQTDPGFPFALGSFFKGIKERYGTRVDLDASRAPLDMVPYVVRHQFRPGEDEWPVLQLGPGVATANLTRPYSWKLFLDEIKFLRENLLDAYAEHRIRAETAMLRYKNAEPFEYSSETFFRFLDDYLNTKVSLPEGLPGTSASKTRPTSGRLKLTFDLVQPKGTGTLTFGTGTQRENNPNPTSKKSPTEAFIWQLEVASGGDDCPDLYNEDEFLNWLDAAHSVIHDWFFTLIEGRLRYQYEGKGSRRGS